MPKVVDHEERRAELCSRRVEAGVGATGSRPSPCGAWPRRRDGQPARWSTTSPTRRSCCCSPSARLRTACGHGSPRRRSRTTEPLELVARVRLVEGLPIGRERQAEVRVWFAFLGLALARPVLRSGPAPHLPGLATAEWPISSGMPGARRTSARTWTPPRRPPPRGGRGWPGDPGHVEPRALSAHAADGARGYCSSRRCAGSSVESR